MSIATQKGFLGIDQRNDFGNNLGVASEMQNFRITESGSMVRRQGINRVCFMDKDIDGIWAGTVGTAERLLFACGGKLYRALPRVADSPIEYIGDIGTGDCRMFEFNGLLYIKCADYYGKYDGSTLTEVEGYIPLIAISCAPDGSGQVYEQINLLTPKRRQWFSGNGSALLYTLAESNVKAVLSITVDGVPYDDKWNLNAGGTVSFASAPAKGLNNVEIIYRVEEDEESRSRITNCRNMMLFGGNSDGRIFLWGNDEYPNHRFYSDLADGVPSAEYFPVNCFTIIGNSKINSIIQQYDRQLIFCEDEAYYSYCQLTDDSLGNKYASFPVFNLNSGKGCIFETKGCVMDNKPVTLCRDGLNCWESTSVENERNAVCFSMPIYKYMEDIISNGDNLTLFDFQANREIYLIYGERAFVYNYGAGAWYIFDNFAGKHHAVYGRYLYFARGGELCVYSNDMDCDLEGTCIWKSAFIGLGSKGNSHLIRFFADMHVKGASNIRFDFEKSGEAQHQTQELVFEEDTDKFLRVSSRPRVKRGLPFRVIFTDMGPGVTTLHGIMLKTRETERSNRNGIL